ncbi:MAG: PASTA domain-containing protein [Candidatus Sumerlaeota bacterium]|nr:PASTA domain-containing protein [Candidatus Sumerlaeota bacterium]
MAALFFLLAGASTALAGNATENLALVTANVVITGPGTGSVGLIDNAALVYNWGAFNAAATGNIRYNQGQGIQFGGPTSVPGSYFLTRFSSGDSAVVSPLKYVDITENNNDFSARILVHTTGGAWLASDPVALASPGAGIAQTFAVASLNWAPVTNAATAIDAAISTPQAFTALTLGTPAAWVAGTAVDGGGIYNSNGDGLNATRIAYLAFKEPVPGGVAVPDVRGQDKTAAAAAIAAVGSPPLVPSEISPKVNSDIYLIDQVTMTTPAGGIEVAPGSTVNMTISGGPDEFWDWTGGAGPADVSVQTNWTLAGTDLSVPANPYAPPIDAGERVAVRSNATWTMGSLSYGGMNVLGNAVLNVSGATLTNTGQTQIGSGGAVVIGAASGKMVINAGSTVTCSNAINIGAVSVVGAGNGTLEVAGGSLTMNTTGGAVFIGALSAGAGAGAGLFHLNGSAGTVLIQRAMNMPSALSTIKWTADADGFCKVVMDQTNRDFGLDHGSVVVDATNAPVTIGTAASFQLFDCGRNILDSGNVLTTGLTITPKTGTAGGDWALEARDTNANSIPDELWLNYTPHVNNPPSFTNDPFSKPSARTGVAYNQSIAGDASDPDVGDLGENAFVVRVTDPGDLSDTATMTIMVSNVSAAKAWTGY